MVDNAEVIIYWNKASEVLYGWSAEEVLGRKFHQILMHHNSETHLEDITKSNKNGKSWSKEYIEKKRDGSFVSVHITHTPIFGEDGEMNGVIGISFDISERRKTEEAMIRKMDELTATNDEMSRINRLTIGREMRMIELKQQCNYLASQLGIDQPYPLTFINDSDRQKKN